MNFQKEKILKEITNDETIKKLMIEENLTIDLLSENYLYIYAYLINKKKCLNCKGLDTCKQDLIGYNPILSYNGSSFVSEYIPCSYLNKVTDKAKKNVNLTAVACSLEDVDATTLYANPARNEIYQKMRQIFKDYIGNKNPKGIYLHGLYGSGKSYIMACFAKKYAENGFSVAFAYFPDLVRQIKSLLGSSGERIEEIIDQLKNADVLFLDDFGGELITPYIRDEVLGSILQERMVKKSLTFVTSNLDYKLLHEHLSETSKNVDEVRASRIEERIKVLMDIVELKDIDYRN